MLAQLLTMTSTLIVISPISTGVVKTRSKVVSRQMH
jgi:hypothetical protein